MVFTFDVKSSPVKLSLDAKDYPDDHLVILADRCKAVPTMDTVEHSDPYGELTLSVVM